MLGGSAQKQYIMTTEKVKSTTALFKQLDDLILQSTDDNSLDTVAKVLAEVGTTSASIAVLEDGEITSHCISTRSDDRDTLFQACSISKPVAGLALMRMVEDGLLSVDDKIVDHLPSDVLELLAKDTRTRRLLQMITVKQLMSHTAGLSVGGFPGYPDPQKVPNTTQVIEGKSCSNTTPIKFAYVPGFDFIYSGGGITIMQRVMEHAAKKPFPQIIQDLVLGPLDMTRSFYHLPSEEKNVSRAFYHGYYPCEVEWHTQPELAAAGLWTTPTDLLKFVRGLQTSLNSNDKDNVLGKKTAREMLTVVRNGVALTLSVNAHGFEHGGSNVPGWRCHMFGWADLSWNAKGSSVKTDKEPFVATSGPKNCGVAIMTNSARGMEVYMKIIQAICYLKGWPYPAPMWGTRDASVPFRVPLDNVKDEREKWQNWVGGPWIVKEEDESGEYVDAWHIAEEKDQGRSHLLAGYGGEESMLRLSPAAMPARTYSNGKQSLDFEMDGLEVLLRLGWDGEERIVEVWNGGASNRSVLRRR